MGVFDNYPYYTILAPVCQLVSWPEVMVSVEYNYERLLMPAYSAGNPRAFANTKEKAQLSPGLTAFNYLTSTLISGGGGSS